MASESGGNPKKPVVLVLKKNDDGVIQISEKGFPIWIDEDGKEIDYDVASLVNKLTSVNNESAGRRKEIETLTERVKVLDEIGDVEKAKEALKIVSNLDAKKLVDSGEIETLKRGIQESYELQISELKNSYGKTIEEKDTKIAGGEETIRKLLVQNAFDSSRFVIEKTNLPSDAAFALFGKYFTVELINGEPRAIARHSNGDKIYSRANPGEPASTEEAIEALVDKYPNKEKILVGTGASGSGAKGGEKSSGETDIRTVMYPTMAKQK